MAYRVRWVLMGRLGRVLDGGTVPEVFGSYGEAAAALSDLLKPYAEVGQSECGAYWTGRRSPDADLEVQVWVESLVRPDRPLSRQSRPAVVFRHPA